MVYLGNPKTRGKGNMEKESSPKETSKKGKWGVFLLLLLASFIAATVAVKTPAWADEPYTKPVAIDPCAELDPKEVRKEYKDVCWYCKPFTLLVTTIATTTNSVFEKTKDGAIKLIAIGFALWLLWVTAVYFFKPKEPGEYIKKIGTQTLRVVFAIALLVTGTKAIDTIYSPIASIALEYGGVTATSSSIVGGGGSLLKMISDSILPTDNSGESTKKSGVSSMNESIMYIFADGVTMWRYSFAHGYKCSIPLFELALVSLLVMLGAIYVMIIVPLKIIDAIFKLGIVIIMTPLFIISWVFPITSKYAYKGWDMFMGSVIFIMFLGVTLAIAVQVINGALFSYTNRDPNIDGLLATFSTMATDFLVLLGAFIFAIQIINASTELAKEFTGLSPSTGAATAAGLSIAAGGVALAGAGTYVGYKAGKGVASGTYKAGKWGVNKGVAGAKWLISDS